MVDEIKLFYSPFSKGHISGADRPFMSFDRATTIIIASDNLDVANDVHRMIFGDRWTCGVWWNNEKGAIVLDTYYHEIITNIGESIDTARRMIGSISINYGFQIYDHVSSSITLTGIEASEGGKVRVSTWESNPSHLEIQQMVTSLF